MLREPYVPVYTGKAPPVYITLEEHHHHVAAWRLHQQRIMHRNAINNLLKDLTP